MWRGRRTRSSANQESASMNLNSSDLLLIDRALQAYIVDCEDTLPTFQGEEAEYYRVELSEAEDLRTRLGVRE